MHKYTGLILLLTLGLMAATSADELDCDKAVTTPDVNHCAGLELQAAEDTMAEYLAASLERHGDDPETVAAIRQAQVSWQAYRDDHCGSVFTYWRGGTIRTVMSITCSERLTRQRTHDLWISFLTHMDSAPPVLPEPDIQ
ncbi:DUF1311 domain-containing protein [Natronospirillum operosum]|uniref:DUF1311 domain-containing protein n=1 Tax=Natronospirillum operosum TaxID=2759953 RepID=A0A4Z0WAE8_9GAMM|nr:lysozyme inhibitor LprI family protein [Natronospirillum operosum]TGG90630.1 DUF1311 domain-containing protein [Natronospirillum operosum]